MKRTVFGLIEFAICDAIDMLFYHTNFSLFQFLNFFHSVISHWFSKYRLL